MAQSDCWDPSSRSSTPPTHTPMQQRWDAERRERFKLVDAHADKMAFKSEGCEQEFFTTNSLNIMHAPTKLKSDLMGLVNYLVSAYDDNIDKVRSIFRWVTRHVTYDVKGFFSGQTAPDESFLEVLCTMKATCKGYCKLFSEMCRVASISCTCVQGYVKGYDYLPGDTFVGRPANHLWNLVNLDITQEWMPVDCSWGAGYIKEGTENFVQEFRDHYFLTPPSYYIRDHFPLDQQWQLVPRPIRLSRFEHEPHVKQAYFRHKVELLHPRDGGMITTQGTARILLRIQEKMTLAYDLHRKDDMKSGHRRIQNCNGKVLLQSYDEFYEFLVFMDEEDDYIFRIYSMNDANSSGLLSFCFRVCQVVTYAPPHRNISAQLWGPTEHFMKCTLSCLTDPIHDGLPGFNKAYNGEFSLEMAFRKQLRVMHKLEYYTDNGAVVEIYRRVMHNYTSGGTMMFIASLPWPGWYKLTIYAHEFPPSKQASGLPPVFYCCILAKGKCEADFLYPRICPRWDTGCSLITPKFGNIQTLNRNKVRVKVPDALKVIGFHSQCVVPFRQKGEKTWEANFRLMSVGGGIFKLSAKFHDDMNVPYEALLLFEVVP